jgi:1,4-dihydroxy-2-naphthoate octaprenyltransferase
LEIKQFLLVQIFMIPVLVYFFVWASRVWRNRAAADFSSTMKMNVLASCCTNAAFMTLIIWRFFE